MWFCRCRGDPTESWNGDGPTPRLGAMAHLLPTSALGRRIPRGTAAAVDLPAVDTCRRRPSLAAAPNHVDPRRRHEFEQVRRKFGVALRIGKGQLGDLIELVSKKHGRQLTLVEPNAHQLKVRFGVLGYQLIPFEA